MRVKRVDHHPAVAIRLAGPHQTEAEIHRDTVRIYIPSVVVTIGDPLAAWSIWKTWHSAELALPRLFPNPDRAAGYKTRPGTKILATVAFTGQLKGRDVQGKTPPYSPSLCGELRVRLGGLTIICDDGYAARTQIKIWGHAYDLCRQVWPGKLTKR